jgi:DNA-binding MarR family transcriptional regulator
VTATVDKLLRLGLVDRTVDAKDRRIVRVGLTAAGHRRVTSRRTKRTAWLAARMHELPADDVRRLSEAADVLEAIVAATEETDR